MYLRKSSSLSEQRAGEEIAGRRNSEQEAAISETAITFRASRHDSHEKHLLALPSARGRRGRCCWRRRFCWSRRLAGARTGRWSRSDIGRRERGRRACRRGAWAGVLLKRSRRAPQGSHIKKEDCEHKSIHKTSLPVWNSLLIFFYTRLRFRALRRGCSVI